MRCLSSKIAFPLQELRLPLEIASIPLVFGWRLQDAKAREWQHGEVEVARVEAPAVSTSGDFLDPEGLAGSEVSRDLWGKHLLAERDACWCNRDHWGDTGDRATLREDSWEIVSVKIL